MFSSRFNRDPLNVTTRSRMINDTVAEISSDEDSPKEESLLYKHNHGNVEFHSENLECLTPGSYLKDSIIQFYLAYLVNGHQHIAHRIHIFDSIFTGQLEKTFINDKLGPAELKRLSKWYYEIDIFEKDYLIFPICSANHWFVIIACYAKYVPNLDGLEEINPCDTSKPTTPGLIILDSLGLLATKWSSSIRDFLDYEWRSRLGGVKRFSHSDMVDYHPNLPKQTNSYDCGIYMLAYISSFLDNPDSFYSRVRRNDPESANILKTRISRFIERVNRDAIKSLIKQLCEINR